MKLSVSSTIDALQAIPAGFSSGYGVSALSDGRFLETERVGFHAVEQLVLRGLATMWLEADVTFHSGDGVTFREVFSCVTRPGVSLAEAWGYFINEPTEYARSAGLRIVRTQRLAFLKRTPAGDELLANGGQAPATEQKPKKAAVPRKPKFSRLTAKKRREILEISEKNPTLSLREIARLAGVTPRTLHNHKGLKQLIKNVCAGDGLLRLEGNAKLLDYDDFS